MLTDSRSYLSDAIDPTLLKRALVIKLRHHGDVLLASPVLSALKAAAPQCEIDALVFADTAAMLAEHPALAQLQVLDRNLKKQGVVKQLLGEWQVLSALRARDYDIVIHLTDHPRGAWLVRLLRPRWSVAPQRSKPQKFALRWWKKSFTHLYKTVGGGRRHTVDTHLDALRRLGIQPTNEARRLCLVPGGMAQSNVDARLAEHGIEAERFIQFHPASRWFFKCWPIEQCTALLVALVERGERIVLTAAPDEREGKMLDAILARSGTAAAGVVNLAGQLSLKELAALTSRAQLFIGVDSAPMHIAAAVGTPCVVLFGPSGDKEWGPWMVRSEIVSSDHPCRPCGLDGCGGGKVSECLTTIPANRVLSAVDRVLAGQA